MASDTRIGTAGWSIPRAVADRFPAEGAGLARYATVFNAVEINTSFYRPHRPTTWARWAEQTPAHFRFAAKVPRVITHERRLTDCAAPVERFLAETSALGDKRGPLLIQTPGTLAFDLGVFAAFVEAWRGLYDGPTAWEPRHPSWFTPDAEAALTQARIARVAADPPPSRIDPALTGSPGGWPGLVYRRLHGAPRMYVTPYPHTFLAKLASETVAPPTETWVVFDNTMSGAAGDNALSLRDFLRGCAPSDSGTSAEH